MLLTAFFFIPVAKRYRGQTYLHEEEGNLPTPG